jgi:hypothetical protein
MVLAWHQLNTNKQKQSSVEEYNKGTTKPVIAAGPAPTTNDSPYPRIQGDITCCVPCLWCEMLESTSA